MQREMWPGTLIFVRMLLFLPLHRGYDEVLTPNIAVTDALVATCGAFECGGTRTSN